jgi:3-hydroxy-3-methylglutaryl CoA synthase
MTSPLPANGAVGLVAGAVAILVETNADVAAAAVAGIGAIVLELFDFEADNFKLPFPA